MKRTISDSFVKELKDLYTPGTKVRLEKMDDVQAPPIGTEGTVIAVDDIGTIHVQWANGSSLGVVYGEDRVSLVDKVITYCYGQKRIWENRKDAIAFFLDAMMNSECSERERYLNVYTDLLSELTVCRDKKFD